MEFMQRGSIETLQKILSVPPSLPLAFHLALGRNFLDLKHILHRDLKPSNVMLNDNLNSKVKDHQLK